MSGRRKGKSKVVKKAKGNGTGRKGASGRFEKGGPGGPGRPPGSPNKTGAMLHGTFLAAFDELGGQEWLVAQARKDPRTFVRALAKMLPREAAVKVEQTVGILSNLDDSDVDALSSPEPPRSPSGEGGAR